MYVVTSNEKNTLTSAQRRQDVQTILAGLSVDPVILWQEIKSATDHEDITSQLPAGYTHHFGPTVEDPNGLPVPISVPSRYSVPETFFLKTKENTAASYDVGSAERFYSCVRLVDLTKPQLPSFYIINTHFTNGCEWDKSVSEIDAQATFLRPYWTAHWDMLKFEIDYIKDDLDATVFYGGDFNRKNSPPFGAAERLAVGDGKIDKLAVIARSVTADLDTTGTIVTLSDHNARWAKWDLAKRP